MPASKQEASKQEASTSAGKYARRRFTASYAAHPRAAPLAVGWIYTPSECRLYTRLGACCLYTLQLMLPTQAPRCMGFIANEITKIKQGHLTHKASSSWTTEEDRGGRTHFRSIYASYLLSRSHWAGCMESIELRWSQLD